VKTKLIQLLCIVGGVLLALVVAAASFSKWSGEDGGSGDNTARWWPMWFAVVAAVALLFSFVSGPVAWVCLGILAVTLAVLAAASIGWGKTFGTLLSKGIAGVQVAFEGDTGNVGAV